VYLVPTRGEATENIDIDVAVELNGPMGLNFVVMQIYGESFLYTCAFDKTYTFEQFVPEHLLAYQISGQTLIYHQRGEMVLEEGQFLIGRKNQFAAVRAAERDFLRA
jgi:hypothetical protein